MASVITPFLARAASCWALVFPWNWQRKATLARDIMYTAWIRRAFGALGKESLIRRPLHLLGGKRIFLGDHFTTGPGLRIETYAGHGGIPPRLTIGRHVDVNFDCHIGCAERIEIGDHVLIASRVFITDHFHGAAASRVDLALPPSERPLTTKGAVVIENDVWIGEGACILPGVRIGRGAVVGANAVVTKNIPPYAVVGGIPAKIIRQL